MSSSAGSSLATFGGATTTNAPREPSGKTVVDLLRQSAETGASLRRAREQRSTSHEYLSIPHPNAKITTASVYQVFSRPDEVVLQLHASHYTYFWIKCTKPSALPRPAGYSSRFVSVNPDLWRESAKQALRSSDSQPLLDSIYELSEHPANCRPEWLGADWDEEREPRIAAAVNQGLADFDSSMLTNYQRLAGTTTSTADARTAR